MSQSQPPVDFGKAWNDDPEVFVLYRYQPSLALAASFFFFFFLSTLFHIVQAAKYRTYYFIPLILGCFFEWTGYVGRIFAHHHQYNLGIYVWQTLLLLLAPTLFAASIYMTLSAIIQATHGESCSLIRPTWLTRIFVCGDLLAFLIQGGGLPPIVACLSSYLGMLTRGGPMAKASTIDAGRNIVVSGLILQISFFTIFLLVSFAFHYRLARANSTQSQAITALPPLPWQSYLYTLYFASILVLFRSCFRVAEFLGGHAGKFMAVEWYMYAFDAAPMVGVVVLLNCMHPGRLGARGLERKGVMIRLDDLGETHIKDVRESE